LPPCLYHPNARLLRIPIHLGAGNPGLLHLRPFRLMNNCIPYPATTIKNSPRLQDSRVCEKQKHRARGAPGKSRPDPRFLLSLKLSLSMAADYPHKIMADVNKVKLTGTRLESAVAAYSAKIDSKKSARPFLTEGSMNRFLTGRAAPITPANFPTAAVDPDLKHSSQKSALFFPFTRIQSNRWEG